MSAIFRRALPGVALIALALMGPAASAQSNFLFGFSFTGDPADGSTLLVLDGSVVLTSTARGWYDQTGFHDPTNDGYVTGDPGTGVLFNNFFTFQVPTAPAPYSSAQLVLFNPFGQFDTIPTLTYTTWDFTGDVNGLVAGTGGVPAFQDLGSGSFYGSVDASFLDDLSFITVSLNSSAVSAINAAQSGRTHTFALGGTVFPVSAVPEPGEWAAMGVLATGLGALVLRARRKRPTSAAGS